MALHWASHRGMLRYARSFKFPSCEIFQVDFAVDYDEVQHLTNR